MGGFALQVRQHPLDTNDSLKAHRRQGVNDYITYRDFNLDDFQLSNGSWQVDWWKRGDGSVGGTVTADRRKMALELAKRAIDERIRK